MEQAETERLRQLGKDRRLAEAVGALDTATHEFLRVAGDENSKEVDVSAAAEHFRSLVSRRNVAFDDAAGITGEAGEQATVTVEVDEAKVRECVLAELKALGIDPDALAAQRQEPPKPVGGDASNGAKAPAAGGKAPEGGAKQ